MRERVAADAGDEWIVVVEGFDGKIERIREESVYRAAKPTFPIPAVNRVMKDGGEEEA